MAALFILAGAATVTGVVINRRYTVLATGTFHPVAGSVTGWVRVINQRSRQQLEVFGMRMGSQGDAEVRLIAASDALDSITAESTASRAVGILPTGSRSATFLIDPPVDLRRFRAVMLWSDTKHQNLVTAPLEATGQTLLGAK
jgi:hypothetical protein